MVPLASAVYLPAILLLGVYAERAVYYGNRPGTATPEMVRSRPVVVNGVEFQAVAQSRWQTQRSSSDPTSIKIELLITNQTKNAIVLETCNTFRLGIENAQGEECLTAEECDWIKLSEAVKLAPGETYRHRRNAKLHWHREAKTCDFCYQDCSGLVWEFENLVPGQYRLRFDCRVTPQTPGVNRLANNGDAVWIGYAITPPIEFAIIRP